MSKELKSGMKEFEIWQEGYAATGEHGTAFLMGRIKAESFEQACRTFKNGKGIKISLDLKEDGSFQYSYPSVWACRLYDNETDARKHFG